MTDSGSSVFSPRKMISSDKMAMKKALFLISLFVTVIGSNGSGELNILHSPESLDFTGSSKVLESSLKDVYSASLGLSVEENSNWDGIVINDPFNTPEAVVEVYIDGVSNLANVAKLKAKSYPMEVDEYEPDTYMALRHRLNQRFINGGNKVVKVNLLNPNEGTSFSEVFGDLKEPKVQKQTRQHLKPSVEEDYQFLLELENLKAITEKVKSGAIFADNIVDFYYFRFRSLHALSDFHGPNSMQTKEAKKLLGDALEELSAAFVSAYKGAALVTVVTSDVAHTRRAVRSVRSDESEVKEDGYSADYAAVFNIIFWFGVVFTFALVAIVYALMDMDPGRDSIIYRMTNTRMKKDN